MKKTKFNYHFNVEEEVESEEKDIHDIEKDPIWKHQPDKHPFVDKLSTS